MKVYVTHDEEGNIVSVNMPDPEVKVRHCAGYRSYGLRSQCRGQG